MTDTAPLPSPPDNITSVAIVGMALRVPGALTLERFWQNLRDGVESITFFDDGQLRAAGASEADLRNPSYVKALGVLEGADLFDAGFFDMPPREAEILDPQHRQLLECSWEALEHAGYAPGGGSFAAAGRIGVMAGVGLNGYLLHNLMGRADLIETSGGRQINLGNDKDFAATRVAYKLDLRGAALNVSTACSTSLVAVALGCQSLLSYQCDMILAGGCSIRLPQDQGYHYHPGGTLSPDGHCRAFDAQAQGTVDGNGVALVVLKRLDDALHDGDTIHAVIRGFAINNDGALKVGYTAPGLEGQAAVIREAQEMAQVSPDTIGYVETHGTGTDLGDLVEITALTEAFRSSAATRCCAPDAARHCTPGAARYCTPGAARHCGLGSVKTNIGHLDTAAGAAGLIKTVLGLSHGQIPPSLHFTRPNPKLNLETGPFYVNAALCPWPKLKGAPRRAGVSSFGIGGTNAHLVVEEAPAAPPSDPGMAWQLLPVSARSPEALQRNAERLAAHLRAGTGVPPADVAYTLQLGRRAFAHRQVILADNRADALAALTGTRGDRVFTGNAARRRPAAVFLFPGQDAQYAGMAQTLYRDMPLFRKEVDLCAASVYRTHGIDLNARLFPPAGAADPAFATDPLPLFVVEYALARVWITLGVRPRAMLGYSLGEYVCACLSGVLELDDALGLAIAAERLLPLPSPGPLLAVSLPENELRPLLTPELEIAMVSAPRQCVVGGRPAAVTALKRTLTAMGASCVTTSLGLPFHTKFMEPFLAPYRAELQKVRFSPPKIPYVSCVTGDWIRPEEAVDPEHYLRLAGRTILLARGLERLFTVPDAVFLEVGPGQVMAGFVMLQNAHPDISDVFSTLRDPRHPDSAASDSPALLTALAKLWTAGMEIDWSALHRFERRRRVPLPTYAFERRRYWVDAQPTQKPAGKLADPAAWYYLPVWRELPPLRRAEITGRWLVAGAYSASALPWVKLLQAAGGEAVYHDFAGSSSSDAACWDALFDRAEQAGKPFDHIVYLGLLGLRGDDDKMLDAGLHSVIALGLSLGRRVFSEPVTLTVIADGLFPADDASLSPAKAAVPGALRVLPQEYPNLRCRVIDVVVPEREWQQTRLLKEAIRELAGDERAVALRQGRRRVEEFVPYPLPEPVSAQSFKAGGVYLITGGLGNIGMALARHIAQQAPGVHLVLTGRTPSDARLRQVQALEAQGAKVRVALADVTDELIMTALVLDVERNFGALNGVIHAAGLVGKESFATLGESSRAFCTAQLNPKLKGARVLEKILGERPLDFCLLCSSLSPILGGLGFTAYAAANACLDALVVEHNRRHPTRWTGVNWEGWRFDAEPVINQAGAAVAELGLSPAEGVAAFARILAALPLERIVLSTGDLGGRIQQWVELNPPPSDATTAPHHARPPMSGSFAAPDSPLETEIARLWERLLGISGIGIHDSFFELGGNSLLLTQLLAQIRKTFRQELSLTSLFERPTIAGIAKLLQDAAQAKHGDEIGEREEGVL